MMRGTGTKPSTRTVAFYAQRTHGLMLVRWIWPGVVASTMLLLGGCSGDDDATSRGVGSASASSAGTGGSGGVGGAGGAGGGSNMTATFLDRTFRCKVLSGEFIDDPSENQVHTRFNMKGSDLGIPVVASDVLHLFFGDTVGYKVIWDFGEDPDSVARIPLGNVISDPTTICRNLDFYVTPDIPSVANGVDPAIQRDFAGAWMTPPPGDAISNYIAQGAGPFANMPGTFEVPTGGLFKNGQVYLFYAGVVELAPRTRATMSYLAQWDVATATVPNYQILRPIDALAGGALGGHFIQITAVERDGFVYLFGTGDYRHSGVYLARVDASTLQTGEGQAIFDPATSTYREGASLSQGEREAVTPLFETDGVGELSVSYIDAAGVFVMLYQRELHDAGGAIVDNRIVLRVASSAEGPWSEAATLIDMADPAFQAAHCCGSTCPGEQILHCDKAGLYGAYLIPAVTVTTPGDGSQVLDIPFVVSTWDPYNVVLFSARVRMGH